MKKCINCGSEFEVTTEDQEFLKKLSVRLENKIFEIPEPTRCPDCRQKRRLSFRNERSLYKRKCDASGKEIISIYNPDTPYIIFSPEEWWSDKWNPFDYGRDFDFKRTFFEQFDELKKSIPHLALNAAHNENSDYVNQSGYNKNCYLIFAAEYNEDCLYGTQIIKSKNCIDTLNCFESQYSYEVVDVKNCYKLFFSQDCKNCSESMFLFNSRSCTNCLFCSNLRNKQYYIFNQPVTKEQFLIKQKEILERLEHGGLSGLKKEFIEMKRKTPQRPVGIDNCENSSGNFLSNCKNAQHCFDLTYAEDCKYVYTGFQIKDLMDVCHTTEVELSYESTSVGYKSYNVILSQGTWTTNNAIYCDNVHSCSNIFGCSNLRQAKYCILNKQYSKEEYYSLVEQIIEHMKKTGEWGEFFPESMSPFGYEETVANDYFPLQKKEKKYEGSIPEKSTICEVTGKPFFLTGAEKNFYKAMGLSDPKRHPDERHKERMELRPARKLQDRFCERCKIRIRTPLVILEAEKVYCEKCYLEIMY